METKTVIIREKTREPKLGWLIAVITSFLLGGEIAMRVNKQRQMKEVFNRLFPESEE